MELSPQVTSFYRGPVVIPLFKFRGFCRVKLGNPRFPITSNTSIFAHKRRKLVRTWKQKIKGLNDRCRYKEQDPEGKPLGHKN